LTGSRRNPQKNRGLTLPPARAKAKRRRVKTLPLKTLRVKTPNMKNLESSSKEERNLESEDNHSKRMSKLEKCLEALAN